MAPSPSASPSPSATDSPSAEPSFQPLSLQDQSVGQKVVVTQGRMDSNELAERIALFDESGRPLTFVQTGADILLTGLVIEGVTPAPVSDEDTVNEAVGKLQAQASAVLDTELTGFDVPTPPAEVEDSDTLLEALGKLQAQASGVLDTKLTGLNIPEVGSAVLATDSVLDALGKMQAQINDLNAT